MVKMVIIGNMYVIMPLAVLSLIQSLLSNFQLLFLNCCCVQKVYSWAVAGVEEGF